MRQLIKTSKFNTSQGIVTVEILKDTDGEFKVILESKEIFSSISCIKAMAEFRFWEGYYETKLKTVVN